MKLQKAQTSAPAPLGSSSDHGGGGGGGGGNGGGSGSASSSSMRTETQDKDTSKAKGAGVKQGDEVMEFEEFDDWIIRFRPAPHYLIAWIMYIYEIVDILSWFSRHQLIHK